MTGYATLEFNSKCTPIQALRLALQIEYFISLVCLSFVSCQRLQFNIEAHDKDGKAAEQHVEVTRAGHIKDVKTELNLTELPIRLQNVDVGAALKKFIKIFDSIEQSLNWYRIVMAEERYIENKYFY